MLMEIATFQTEMFDSDTLSPFEMLMEIGAYEAEKYDSENQPEENQCWEVEAGSAWTFFHSLSSNGTEKFNKRSTEDSDSLTQPMKITLKRQRSSERREPKLMNSAMKVLYEIPGYYNDAKRENDRGTFEQDVITVEPMKKKQRHKQKQKVVKNSATCKSSHESETKTLKRNLKELSNEEWIEEVKNRRKKQNDGNPPAIPSLPEEFEREIMERCGGRRPNQMTRIIQKPLYSTDLSAGHNRITMPCSQVESFEFLSDSEMTRLRRDEAITVPVIHRPSKNGTPLPLAETPLEFKQWNLHKNDPHKENPQYVLRTAWRKVVLKDELEIGDTVQIWAYRNAQDRLCMALVKLDSHQSHNI